MKGKLKFSLKIILTVAISLFAGVCFVGLQPALNAKKELSVHAVATLNGKEYSALLDGDVVLSVEKVAVDKEGKYSEPITGTGSNKFYQRDEFQGEKEIYFQDIYQDAKSKQVVEDGQFVMLNNKYQSGYYQNTETGKADAVIISLGQYVYYDFDNNNTKEIQSVKASQVGADIDYAQMTFLSVSMLHNGKEVSGLSYRNIDTTDGSRFYDFMYMITEDGVNDIEGHYTLTTNYIKGGVEYSADFEFYLVCESTYTRTTTIEGQTYTSAPVLGWTKDNEYKEAGVEDDDYVHYYEGKDGINNNTIHTSTISYPTITYDYTKYQMSYTLTANRNITTYSFTYSPKNTSEATMTCSTSGIVSDEKTFPLLNYGQNLKLVTIVLTEQGNYDISFKYLYTGEDKANAPTMDKLKIENKKLAIHGVDLNYSKQDYTSAQFRKFNFATNAAVNVALVIPNGYEQTVNEENIQKYKNKALDFMYKTNDSNLNVTASRKIRVGEVIVADDKDAEGKFITKDRTEDTLQNRKFENNSAISTFVSGVLDTSKYSEASGIYDNSILNLNDYNFEYIKTNQGSMWLSYTDKILETKDNATVDANKSFYFYSRNSITENSLVVNDGALKTTAKPYNNQTSFNQVGYYLVFVKIDPKSNTSGTEGVTDDYWQVYAFQYMSDTIDIEVKTTGATNEAKNNVDIGAGKYTTENVTISWKEPETFETKIVGKYYKITNSNATREELLSTNENVLTKNAVTNKTQVLGGDVAAGQFAKYLIKLERAGKSATYKMFTIDRQPISGVVAYAIKTRMSTNSVYYEVATKNGEPIEIRNGITNSYSTIGWNQKASGAQITATYSYTPFIADTNATSQFINQKWITTNYKLGTTINNCDLAELTFKGNVSYDSVLMGQGIYVFTIIDEAGNATKYMLVIDNTEAYIQINDGTNTEILPNGAFRLYGHDVSYTTGTHKAISLNFAEHDTNEISSILPFILNKNLASYKDTNEITYYKGDSSANINAMYNLFNEFNAKNYLTVKNQKVVAYNNYSIDEKCSSTNPGGYKTIVFNREDLGGATSLIRSLYVVGVNMTYSASYNDNAPNQSISYAKIEINTDNSRGMAYYGNTLFDITSIPNDGGNGTNIIKLETGSDVFNNDETVKISGLGTLKAGAHATKDKYVAFTWLVGEEKFTVKTLKYQYYELNLSGDYYDANGKYFYKENGNEVTLYDGVSKDKNVVIQDGRGFFLLNNEYDGTTKAGLYKFTRYYKIDPQDDPTVDYGDDSYSLNYYFIVDRNGIHDVTNQIGKNITIGLMNGAIGVESETFSLVSTSSKEFKYDINNDGIIGKEDIEEKYYVYFQANRVPAILNLPTGKYDFNSTENKTYYSSYGYFAGQLRISVYYQDLYNQISNNTGTPYKLLDIDVPNSTTGYYTINFVEEITKWENSILDKMIANTKDGKSWLHLQGRYIILIEDNVETTSKSTNKKIIGFDIIEEKYPEAEIKVGGTNNADNMTKVMPDNFGYGNLSVMTNQEFIRVDLPEIKLSEGVDKNVLAQVDQQYILVKQNFNNQGEKDYIKAEYGSNLVGKLEEDSGKKFIYLDTLLRDKEGNILTENFSKPLYYTVTIRYQIGTDGNNKEIYKDCYTYYEFENGVSVKKYYYYSTYKITIDRLAPTINVENLRKEDSLIKQGYIDAEFEADYYEESQMYFTYQYADYYNFGKNLSDIYAFRATEKTLYNTTEVATLYVSNAYQQDELKNLSLNLPIVSFGGFNQLDVTKISNFGNIFGDSQGYYQILELDAAGNMTQYIVYYSNSTQENLKLPIKYQSTTGENVEFIIGQHNSTATIDLFKIENNGEVANSGDYFYYVSLTDNNNLSLDNWKPLKFVTNFATAYSGDNSLTNQVIKAIGSRKGTYELKITPRAGITYSLGIGLYSDADKIELDVEKLIVKENGKFYINLRGANILKNNNIFYAKEIIVVEKVEGEENSLAKRYICKIESGSYNYYYDNNTPQDLLDDVLISGAILNCKDNTTYKLTIVDVFEKSKSTRFNTAGKEFYNWEFDIFGKSETDEQKFKDEQGHYYTYSDVTIDFDGLFTLDYGDDIIVKIDNEQISDLSLIKNYVVIDGNSVTIKKFYDAENDRGHLINVVLQFREAHDSSLAEIYNITIDSTMQKVILKDFTTGDVKNLTLYNNGEIINIENLKKLTPNDVTSGIMNLSWTRESKEHYQYTYQLFELKKGVNGSTIIEQDINNVSNFVIDTQEDSMGIYWFVINVLTPNGEIIGNKIYALEVQAVNNQLYYVKNEEGLAINSNSTFNVMDIQTLINNEVVFKYGSLTGADIDSFELISNMPSTNLPLYITNQNLEIVLTENVTSSVRIAALDLYNNQTLSIYIVDATTYKLYFGILKISKTTDLVDRENISGLNVGSTLLDTIVDETKPNYTLNAERTQNLANILSKNLLLLDVYYNETFVKTITFDREITYTILGNGSYTFNIRDLAGNKHIFENGTLSINTLILREVVVTINDQAPVENAYYNGEVSLKVYAATKYVTGSIKVKAFRNGNEYKLASANPYIFKDYGTYVVKVEAIYKDAAGHNHTLYKNLTFTILNVNEVRTSIDLTNLRQHTITKVTNPNGIDITNEFIQMINNKTNAMLIKHEEIMNNAEALQVSAGKLLFTIDYLVSDKIYPDRTLQVQFTLNDEMPIIKCSLEVGESTKKEFDITFNPGIIFDQIGESYVYINDKIVYTINESSPTEVVKIIRSFKEHGDGDYYIRLVGTSGTVWQSFKVEIEEPLNTSAIIIIVVVSAVIITVVVTIIVLRRKMRIR